MAWLLIFCCLVIVTFVFTVFWKMCENPRVASLQDPIDLTQFCKFYISYVYFLHGVMLHYINDDLEGFLIAENCCMLLTT